MKKALLGLALAAMPWFSAAAASGESLDAGAAFGPFTTPVISDIGATDPYVLDVQSAGYQPSSSGYGTYASAISSVPGFHAGDNIFAYIVTNDPLSSPDSAVGQFTVHTDATIDAAAVVPDMTNVSSQVGGISNIHGVSSVLFTFGGNDIGPGQSSEILLIASPNAGAAFNPVHSQNTFGGDGLALTPGGVLRGGTPLPTPAAAWGGMSLVGLLAGARLRKGQKSA